MRYIVASMLPLREMPSTDPRDLHVLYARRAREGLVVCAEASRVDYPVHLGFRPEWGCLSIVAVRGGREEYHFPDDGRTLVVDDDVYLVLDSSSRYSYRLRTRGRARCLMISFPPSMVASIAGRVTNDLDEECRAMLAASPRTFEHLAAHDTLVSPELRRIESGCLHEESSEEWYRQQMGVLLTRILEARAREEAGMRCVPALRASTRRELARRVALATDCIHENYRRPLDLQTLASAARLSPFHLLRVFKSVHGVTPQEFLQRKRAWVAARLLRSTHCRPRASPRS